MALVHEYIILFQSVIMNQDDNKSAGQQSALCNSQKCITFIIYFILIFPIILDHVLIELFPLVTASHMLGFSILDFGLLVGK